MLNAARACSVLMNCCCRKQLAKLLQNLSNGVKFGDKEVYMKVLNVFIEAHLDPLQDYFDKLISVDELDDTVQVRFQ